MPSVVYSQDSDGDLINDNIDLDDDNDGILDTDESIPTLVNYNSAANGSTIPWLGSTTSNIVISTTSGFLANNIGTTFTTPFGEQVSYSATSDRWQKTNEVSFVFTFLTPVPADEIAFHIVDVNNTGNPRFNVVVGGGATVNDFELAQAGTAVNLSYDSAIGQIVRSAGTARQSGVLVGNSKNLVCLLYTSPSPRDQRGSRMPSSA